MNEPRIREVKPLKNLTFVMIWAIGVGSVIGDGIFLMLGQGFSVAGPGAVGAFLVAGVIQMCIMIGLGELAVGMPNAGAMSVWVERFLGKKWGFFSGFAFAAGWVIAGGSVSIALGRVTCWFFPSLNQDTWAIVFAIMFLTLFAIFNLLGGLFTAKLQFGLVLLLIVIMIGFAIVGCFKIDISNLSPMLPNGWQGFIAALPMGTYAYIGAVTLTTCGAECKDPRDLGKGLVAASVTFLVLYTIDMLIVAGIVPWNKLGIDTSPFTYAANIAMGPIGGAILNVGAWVAAATCILVGTFYAASRIFYQLSKDGYLPSFLGDLTQKTRTPAKGIVFILVCSVLLVLLSILSPDFVYITLANQMIFAWIISWGMALIAGIVYRKKAPGEIEKAGWKQPLFPLFPVLGLVGCLYVMYITIAGDYSQFIPMAVWIALLFIFYQVYSKNKSKHLQVEREEKEVE